MDVVAVGFWGGFFGTAGLMLAASLLAFVRSLHRVALTAALSAAVSALFVIAYLGWLPVADAHVLDRLLAHIATLTSAVLAWLLLAMLGLLKRREVALRIALGLGALAAVVLVTGWLLEPRQALALGSAMAMALGLVALGTTLRNALRGDRLAWVAVSGVFFMVLAVGGLSAIALAADALPWPVHALTALAAMAYLATMASVMWARYSYLIEVHQAMAFGPNYDPVTRMRSHVETGQMVGAAFHRHEGEPRPVGVLVISIGNLYALEKLHGRAAVNHALFVCASRLRRSVPGDVEMGRLEEDGFLMLLKNSSDHQRLVQLARTVTARLLKPVSLSTQLDVAALEGRQAPWVADVGVGVLVASSAHIRAASAVAMARAMSHTAWSYTSRIAWFDQTAGQIAELPPVDLDTEAVVAAMLDR